MSTIEYTETQALLAALEQDDEQIETLVLDMLPFERRTLIAALERLSRHLHNRCKHCDLYVENLTGIVVLEGAHGRVAVHSDCLDAYKATLA